MYRVTYEGDECPHHCSIQMNKNNPRNFPQICLGGGFSKRHVWKITMKHTYSDVELREHETMEDETND